MNAHAGYSTFPRNFPSQFSTLNIAKPEPILYNLPMKPFLFLLAVVGFVVGNPILGRADDNQARFAKFAKELSGVKLVGQFTVDGGGAPSKEEYTILKVKKIEQGDLWLFKARVKFGKIDLTLPMPIPVKWAGDTPVISLDNLTIPGLGTFSAHVVIDGNKYAGTWKHGKAGGHMFGKIVKLKE